MQYGTKTFSVCCLLILFILAGCNPAYRFRRLVNKHPELLDSLTKTEIVVRNQQIHDTILYFKSDTIITEYATIYRTADTIRLITREKPCTTYVHNTEIRPTQIKERKVVQFLKDKKAGFVGSLYQGIIGLLVLALIFVSLRKR